MVFWWQFHFSVVLRTIDDKPPFSFPRRNAQRSLPNFLSPISKLPAKQGKWVMKNSLWEAVSRFSSGLRIRLWKGTSEALLWGAIFTWCPLIVFPKMHGFHGVVRVREQVAALPLVPRESGRSYMFVYRKQNGNSAYKVHARLGFIILLSNSLETVSDPVASNVSMMHHFLLCRLCLRNNRFPHVAELLTAVWSSASCPPPPGLSSFRVDGHSACDLVRTRTSHLNVTLLSLSHARVPSA